MVAIIAPGFSGEKRELTIALTRILFPGAGLLVVAAWCLGVLNSHLKVPALLRSAGRLERRDDQDARRIRREFFPDSTRGDAGVGSVLGSLLQVAAQVPAVLRVAPDLRFTFDVASEPVRTVGRNFVPSSLPAASCS